MPTNPRQILIVGPSWVGDMVMSQSLYRLLRQRHPSVAIDVLAPAWSQPILERMPEVRRAIDMPVGHGQVRLSERFQLAKQLQRQGYDWSIVLPNSLKSALIPALARIPRRIGWRGEMRYGLLNDLRALDKARYPLMIDRFAALALPAGEVLPTPLPWPQLKVDSDQATALLGQLQLDLARPVLALCPGAEFGEAKRWPTEYYAAVATQFIADGYQVWVMGSANDEAVARQLVAAIDGDQQHAHVLAGQTQLAEATDLLSLTSAVVSNDSGLMHIAAALQIPLAVIYGSTSPDFTPPLAERVAVVRNDVDCGPCFQRDCPLPAAERRNHCLTDIEPRRVIEALQSLLASSTTSDAFGSAPSAP